MSPSSGYASSFIHFELLSLFISPLPPLYSYSSNSLLQETKRLHKSPAIITDHETASYRRMMKYATSHFSLYLNTFANVSSFSLLFLFFRQMDSSKMPELPKQQLEVNASHPLIKSLFHQRDTHPLMAKEVAEQVLLLFLSFLFCHLSLLLPTDAILYIILLCST